MYFLLCTDLNLYYRNINTSLSNNDIDNQGHSENFNQEERGTVQF